MDTTDGKIIAIIDHANESGTMSVTNDAEAVVEEVVRVHGDYPIVYKDTMDSWDELVHDGGKFRHFSPIQSQGHKDAVQDL